MTISISPSTPSLQLETKKIAQKYQFNYLDCIDTATENHFHLQLTEQHLQLIDLQNSAYNPLLISFVSGKTDHRRLYGGGKSQLLAKAVGLNKGFKAHILDATAGLGGDSFVLACLGCKVTLLERSPVLAAMLADALYRGQQSEEIKSIIASMQLIHADSVQFLCADKAKDKTNNEQQTEQCSQPDIIYLDPMFPDKKGSALVKKEMQYLQQLVGKDMDSSQLLSCAIQQAKYRVVVKRPIRAPLLDGQKPILQLASKKQRFDIYINQKLPNS
ncbi:MAG: class I SAM-dependent methyltransferase [Pseudomonadota bacterium]